MNNIFKESIDTMTKLTPRDEAWLTAYAAHVMAGSSADEAFALADKCLVEFSKRFPESAASTVPPPATPR